MSNRPNRPPPLELVSPPAPRPVSSIYSTEEQHKSSFTSVCSNESDFVQTECSYTYVNKLFSPSSPIKSSSFTNPDGTVSFLYSHSGDGTPTLISSPQAQMILYGGGSIDTVDSSVAELPWYQFTQNMLKKQTTSRRPSNPNLRNEHNPIPNLSEKIEALLLSPTKSDYSRSGSMDSQVPTELLDAVDLDSSPRDTDVPPPLFTPVFSREKVSMEEAMRQATLQNDLHQKVIDDKMAEAHFSGSSSSDERTITPRKGSSSKAQAVLGIGQNFPAPFEINTRDKTGRKAPKEGRYGGIDFTKPWTTLSLRQKDHLRSLKPNATKQTVAIKPITVPKAEKTITPRISDTPVLSGHSSLTSSIDDSPVFPQSPGIFARHSPRSSDASSVLGNQNYASPTTPPAEDSPCFSHTTFSEHIHDQMDAYSVIDSYYASEHCPSGEEGHAELGRDSYIHELSQYGSPKPQKNIAPPTILMRAKDVPKDIKDFGYVNVKKAAPKKDKESAVAEGRPRVVAEQAQPPAVAEAQLLSNSERADLAAFDFTTQQTFSIEEEDLILPEREVFSQAVTVRMPWYDLPEEYEDPKEMEQIRYKELARLAFFPTTKFAVEPLPMNDFPVPPPYLPLKQAREIQTVVPNLVKDITLSYGPPSSSNTRASVSFEPIVSSRWSIYSSDNEDGRHSKIWHRHNRNPPRNLSSAISRNTSNASHTRTISSSSSSGKRESRVDTIKKSVNAAKLNMKLKNRKAVPSSSTFGGSRRTSTHPSSAEFSGADVPRGSMESIESQSTRAHDSYPRGGLSPAPSVPLSPAFVTPAAMTYPDQFALPRSTPYIPRGITSRASTMNSTEIAQLKANKQGLRTSKSTIDGWSVRSTTSKGNIKMSSRPQVQYGQWI